MERTLGLLQEWFFWPKMAEDVQTHIRTCDRCLKFKQSQEKSEMQPILSFLSIGTSAFGFSYFGWKGR